MEPGYSRPLGSDSFLFSFFSFLKSNKARGDRGQPEGRLVWKQWQ